MGRGRGAPRLVALARRLDSRLRGNDGTGGYRVWIGFALSRSGRGGGGWLGAGACAPSWRLRADWIPAYAGMTGPGVGSRFSRAGRGPGGGLGTGRGAPRLVALARRGVPRSGNDWTLGGSRAGGTTKRGERPLDRHSRVGGNPGTCVGCSWRSLYPQPLSTPPNPSFMLLFYEEEGALARRLDSRLRGNDGHCGVDSRFRGQGVAAEMAWGGGAGRPVSWRLRGGWVRRLRGNDGTGGRFSLSRRATLTRRCAAALSHNRERAGTSAWLALIGIPLSPRRVGRLR